MSGMRRFTPRRRSLPWGFPNIISARFLRRSTNPAHIKLPEDVYTGIWWYGRFPDHYSGDGSVARPELGQWNLDGWVASIVEALRAAKADDASLRLQNEFYDKAKHPLDTKQ